MTGPIRPVLFFFHKADLPNLLPFDPHRIICTWNSLLISTIVTALACPTQVYVLLLTITKSKSIFMIILHCCVYRWKTQRNHSFQVCINFRLKKEILNVKSWTQHQFLMHRNFSTTGCGGTVRYPRRIICLITITISTNVSGSWKLVKAMESYL